MSAYAKTITALVTGVLGWAAVVIASASGRVTASEWLGLAVAVATALGVYQVKNTASERGAVDAGSCAIGVLIGVFVGWLIWKNGGV